MSQTTEFILNNPEFFEQENSVNDDDYSNRVYSEEELEDLEIQALLQWEFEENGLNELNAQWS